MDESGFNIDLYGDPGPVGTILVPTPGGVEPCPLKEEGDCPQGCAVCVQFVEEMNLPHCFKPGKQQSEFAGF